MTQSPDEREGLPSAIENRILAVLSLSPKTKVWAELEIARKLELCTVPICALERLERAGFCKLYLDANTSYLAQLI